MVKKQRPKKIRTWIDIDKGAIKNNYRSFRSLIPKNCRLMAVVKSNAYGHGLIDFSKEIEKLGADWLGVDSILEAFTLRKEGLQKPILVLGYTLEENIKEAIKNNISLTVSSLEALARLVKSSLKKPVKIHLKIDTGMHRQGFFLREMPKAVKMLRKHKNKIKVEGIYTHFANVKDPKRLTDTKKQINQFKKAVDIVEKAGFNPIKHASATSGMMVFPNAHFGMVRVGVGLYGLWPSKKIEKRFKKKIGLRPALEWKTIIGEIKKIPRGGRIGYNFTKKLSRNSKIAVLPIGYWHGYDRLFSNKAKVLIRGREANVLGIVSMGMITVDITGIKNAKVGDEALLLGEKMPADYLAGLAKTINYEITTRLNPRMKRVYR